MRYLVTIGAAIAALAFAGTADAQVTPSTTSSSGNFLTLNSLGLYNGSTQVASLSGGTVYNNDMPFADQPKGSVSSFLAAGPSSGILATLTFTNPVSYLGFLWGSPDTYNRVTVNSSTGTQTFSATDLGFANTSGNQSLSQYVSFAANAGSYITSVSFFNNPQIDAFETANFSVASPVPEPAAWAMMIAGLGFMGLAMRRQPKVATRVRFG